MTAITTADRSTQTWGDDALGPNTFETREVLSEAQRKERRLYEQYPELEVHVESEWNVLQSWVAFKMAPAFVEQIFKGKPLQLGREEAINHHIIPEYRTAQMHYLSESAQIIGTRIPDIKTRIVSYSEEADTLDEMVADTLDAAGSGELSPKARLDVESWSRQAAGKRKLVSELEADLPNAELNARVKDATFYRASDLVARLGDGERTHVVDDIIFESKKMAITHALTMLKSDRAQAEADEEEETIIRGYNRKIELLEMELQAYDDILSEDTEQITTS